MDRISKGTVLYKCYLNGSKTCLDVTSVDLPEITFKSNDMSGAGIIGNIDAPVFAFIDSMKLKLSFRNISPAQLKFIKAGKVSVVLYAIPEEIERGTLESYFPSIKTTVAGFTKSVRLGTVQGGEPTNGSVEVECINFKIEIKNEVKLKIEKLNSVFEYNGIDVFSLLENSDEEISLTEIENGYNNIASVISGSRSAAALGSILGA